jgi:hypothetical protein
MRSEESITSPEANAPALSIVLPTDSYRTIQPVLQHLRQQTIARQIEVVLIVPAAEIIAESSMPEEEFAAIRIVEVVSLSPLGSARARGVREASARFVFIGETHSFLHSNAAEKLVAAAVAGSWAAVSPGFENGNPKGVSSWSSFLADYGCWSACLPAGEIPDAPLYNALYRRAALLEMGDSLQYMLSHGDDLRLALHARGQRAYFEPAAQIDHMNLNRLGTSLHGQFLTGILIGSRRAARWSWSRRLLYIFGAPLIPFVLFRRMWPGIRRAARARRLPLVTLPSILLLMFAKAAGELVGYAGKATSTHEAAMDHYEIRKLEYLA